MNDLESTIATAAPSVGLSLFADDSALLATGRSLQICASKLQPALDAAVHWCREWKVELSVSKCCYTTFTLDPAEVNGKRLVDLELSGEPLRFELTPTFLGVKLDCQLTFGPHVQEVRSKMATRRRPLVALARRSSGASSRVLRTAFVATVRAVSDYGCAIWAAGAAASTLKVIESQQLTCARLIT